MEYELIAKTFMGLENVLVQELAQLGAHNIQPGRRVVSFTGDKEMMYRANFQLRTATRILKAIKHFKARSAEEVYQEVKKVDWSEIILPDKTFAVDAVVYSDEFRNSHFVSYKVKDAIVDQFRERTGSRPNVSIANPDIRLHIHIAGDDATLSLDSSGESLHLRGYKQANVKAPLNEVLAAGIILLTGWHGECDFIDPMCGSGTLPIEAALIARNIAPGVFRKGYAFEKWPDFDADLFDNIYNDDSQEREFEHHIYGYDIDGKAVGIARTNIKAAGLSKDITVDIKDFKDFTKPAEKSIIVMNPPYGERLKSPNLLATYKMIGERLKHEFGGNEAWIICNHEELFEQVGLKPSIKIPLYNGSIECELRKYTLFDGRLSDFRGAGGIVKTDDEREEMARPHRFKTEREFKRRLDDTAANESGDIRSFKFHTLDTDWSYGRRHDRSRRYDDDRPRRYDDERPRRFNEERPRRYSDDRPRRYDDDRPRRYNNEDRPRRYNDDRSRRNGNRQTQWTKDKQGSFKQKGKRFEHES